MNYTEARRIFLDNKKGGLVDRRKVWNNTYAEKDNETDNVTKVFNIRLHHTDIITFTSQGIILRTTNLVGGKTWRTVTTKRRMNQVFDRIGVPLRVWQEKFDWHVYNYKTKQRVDFEEGIIVGYGGELSSQNKVCV